MGGVPHPTTTAIPFLDLNAQHSGMRAEILDDVGALLDSSSFINGPKVEEFEAAFASYCGGIHCVGVASGLDALRRTARERGQTPLSRCVLSRPRSLPRHPPR